mgnify:CR=1 FL=1
MPQARTLADAAIWKGDGHTVTGRAEPERVMGISATFRLLPLLGVQPMLGRADCLRAGDLLRGRGGGVDARAAVLCRLERAQRLRRLDLAQAAGHYLLCPRKRHLRRGRRLQQHREFALAVDLINPAGELVSRLQRDGH